MDEKILKPGRGGEEEYHFVESEAAKPYGAKKTPGPGGVTRRTVFIAIGVIVVGFIFYKMLGVLFAPRPAVPPVTPPPVMEAPTPQPAPLPTAALSDRLSSVETTTKVTADKLTQLGTQLQQLQTSMTNLTSAVTSMNQVLQDLSKATQQQTQLLKNLQPPPKPVKKGQPIARQTFYIKAMIPGRAWIVSKTNGHSLTVTQGSTIPGYGQVQKIDPQTGLITTSTGDVIRYNPDDY